MELDKKIIEVLRDFAHTFADTDDWGEWWGHDTNLGKCKEEFEIAKKKILKLINESKISNSKR